MVEQEDTALVFVKPRVKGYKKTSPWDVEEVFAGNSGFFKERGLHNPDELARALASIPCRENASPPDSPHQVPNIYLTRGFSATKITGKYNVRGFVMDVDPNSIVNDYYLGGAVEFAVNFLVVLQTDRLVRADVFELLSNKIVVKDSKFVWMVGVSDLHEETNLVGIACHVKVSVDEKFVAGGMSAAQFCSSREDIMIQKAIAIANEYAKKIEELVLEKIQKIEICKALIIRVTNTFQVIADKIFFLNDTLAVWDIDPFFMLNIGNEKKINLVFSEGDGVPKGENLFHYLLNTERVLPLGANPRSYKLIPVQSAEVAGGLNKMTFAELEKIPGKHHETYLLYKTLTSTFVPYPPRVFFSKNENDPYFEHSRKRQEQIGHIALISNKTGRSFVGAAFASPEHFVEADFNALKKMEDPHNISLHARMAAAYGEPSYLITMDNLGKIGAAFIRAEQAGAKPSDIKITREGFKMPAHIFHDDNVDYGKF